MKTKRLQKTFLSLLLIGCIIFPISINAQTQEDLAKEELAKKSQNPVGNMISVPLEYWYHGDMAEGSHMNLYIAKPVYPVTFGNITLINRFILPLATVSNKVAEPSAKTTGLVNMQYQGFFTSASPGKVIWGLGPVFEFPTVLNDIGSDKFSAGPGLVVLTMPGKWVLGCLAQNIWSFGGSDVNMFTFQYFINYNISDGWYVTTTPILTANWNNESGNQWTVPFGGGVGKLVKIGGKLPVDFKLQGFKNVVTPTGAAEWNIMFAVKLLFPK